MDKERLLVKQGARLVYFRVDDHQTTEELWSSHWQNLDPSADFYKRFERGYLSVYSKIFPKHLPPQGKIIEAGRGRAQYVVALRSRGYDCDGIDTAISTIEQINQRFPDLPVSKGDVLDLEYETSSISGYISLGVVEHFQEGPQKALAEAYRVIEPGGVGIISVPVNNPLRSRFAEKDESSLPDQARFYQYAFDRREFEVFLNDAGFTIEKYYAQDLYYSMNAGIPICKSLFKRFPLLRAIDRIANRTPLVKKYGRSGIWIVRKPQSVAR
jgi:SAM-dependent methyltransferase